MNDLNPSSAVSISTQQFSGLSPEQLDLLPLAVSAPPRHFPKQCYFFSVRRRLCAAVCATPPVRRAAACAQVRTGERPTRWPTRWSHRPPAYSGGVTFTRRLSGNHLLRLLDAVG